VLTDPVNVPALVGSFPYEVNAFVEDPFVRFSGVSQVTVTVTIRKR
jgi:hypothetical protein